jgi:hypothetical protein
MAEAFFILSVLVSVLLLVGRDLAFMFNLDGSSSVSGSEGLVGSQGAVLKRDPDQNDKIWVRVHGERWLAMSPGFTLDPGQPIEVTAIDGLCLIVRPNIEESAPTGSTPRWLTPTRAAGLAFWLVSCAASLWAFGSVLPGLLAVPLLSLAALMALGGGGLW